MMAMSPIIYQNLGWELGSLQHDALNLDNNNYNYWSNLDSLVNLPNNFTTNHINDYDYNQTIEKKRSESPGSASSADNHVCGNVLTKKLNHNASERDRRRKINDLYSTLRALLPPNHHSKKLSIPNTVGRVLKYIPELQKEVDDLIYRKDELLSKCSILQGVTSELLEEKPKLKDVSKDKNSCSISASKLGDNEIIIQISCLHNISLHEVLLKLEMDGLVVLDVSSFLSFGGITLYNIHLWIQGGYNVNCETLNKELSYLVYKQTMYANTNMNKCVNML